MRRLRFSCWIAAMLAGVLTVPGLAAQTVRPPNVVLILSDDHGWGDYGFMGNRAVQTPNLDRLAADSARFTHAYVPTSVCRPSLATLLTGLYPHEHGVFFNHPPPGYAALNKLSASEYYAARGATDRFIESAPALPRILASHGYRCMQTGKYWEGHYRTAGFSQGMTTGRAAMTPGCFDKTLRDGSIVAHGNGDAGLAIGRQTMQPVLDFLDQNVDHPFFLWYAPVLPHAPHDASGDDVARYEGRADVPAHFVRYYANITRFDRTVGQLLDYLEAKKLMANTLIVYLADNGWAPDPRKPEREDPRSKLSPYEIGIRTPLLLHWSGRIRPAAYDGIVSSVDFAPTVLAAAGLEEEAENLSQNHSTLTPGPSPARRERGYGIGSKRMSGRSLLPVAEGKMPLAPRPAFGEIYPNDASQLGQPGRDLKLRWVRSGRWKLIVPVDTSAAEELYDLSADPREERNLAHEARWAEEKARLRAMLDEWWQP